MKYNRRFLVPALALAVLAAAPGCTTQTVSGKPLAELTYDNIQPLYVSAANIDVVDNYNPSADPQDVSSRFPTPPDIAVRRWAERRLQPGVGTGTLRFVIDSVTAHKSAKGPENTLERWTGQGATTTYNVVMKISMSKQTDARIGNSNHAFTVTRSVTIPDNWSIAQREAEMQSFVETIVAAVDEAVMGVLRAESLITVDVAPIGVSAPAASAAPEIRAEQHQNGENFQSSYNH
jgi:hypothetical protein